MKIEDVEALLELIHSYDARIGRGPKVASAWADALAPQMGFEWATQCVVDYYAKDNARAVSVGHLNGKWKDKVREHSMLRSVPAFTGTPIEKDRARWWMMQGIIEGVDEMNACHSRDPHVAGILKMRADYHRETGRPVPQRDHRAAFPTLDWDWFYEVAPTFGARLGY